MGERICPYCEAHLDPEEKCECRIKEQQEICEMKEHELMNDINAVITVEQVPESIKFNYEEVKAHLQEVLREYQGAVFADDSVKMAKAIVAELRKQQKELDSRRITAKKEWMKPFDEFEIKAKELIKMYDEPILFIDGQVKGFEERQKVEKNEKISKLYEEIIGEMKEFLPLNKIYNPKWENLTFTMKAVKEEIELLAISTSKAVDTIQAMNSEAVEKALSNFKNDLSLTNAISYINDYERQKAEIIEKEKERVSADEERKKNEEIEKIKLEERQKLLAEQQEEIEKKELVERAKEEGKREAEIDLLSVKEKPVVEDDLEAAFVPENIAKAVFTVFGNEEEIEQVEMYLNSIGLEYKRS